MTEARIFYQRCAFSTHLDRDRAYTTGHAWIRQEADGLWRVGLTAFAVRLLGELVELDFRVAAGQTIHAGEVIGSIEGFKAVSDLPALVSGRFVGPNPRVLERIELLQSDPQGVGWLYAVEAADCGELDTVDARGYVVVLDQTIDEMLAEEPDGEDTP